MESDASQEKPTTNLSPGKFVGGGRYRLLTLLGRGGMGVVWMAEDTRLQEKVALKFVPPEIGHDPVAFDGLRRETLKSRRLTHPNIIRIHDLCEVSGESPFIVMEYVDGETLEAIRLRQPGQVFTWNALAPLVAQMCAALDYAHGEKVIHRDFKPGNMMLDSRGRLKLADLGIAATLQDSSARSSLQVQNSGTLVYMSPQQMDGATPQPTDDLYALGATLYDLLTGATPFHSGDIAHQVRTTTPPPVNQRLAELQIPQPVPAYVEQLIAGCLNKDSRQRPQSAREVAEILGLSFAQTSVVEKPTSRRRALVMTAAAIASTSALAYAGWHFKRKRASDVATKADAAAAVTPAVFKPGSVDETFDPVVGNFVGAQVVAAVPTGKVMVVWNDQTPGGRTRTLMRLNPEGTSDPSFNALRIDQQAYQICFDTNSDMLMCGDFMSVRGIRLTRLTRIGPAGLVHQRFKAHLEDGLAHSLAIGPDRSIIVGGTFKTVDGKPYRCIVRLNPAGKVAEGFKPVEIDGLLEVRAIAVQPDGRILIAGWKATSTIATEISGMVARINADGTLDKTFDVGSGPNRQVMDLALQPDGKLILAGNFTEVSGSTRKRIARLNSNGTLDSSFQVGDGANGQIRTLALQKDGRILIGNRFTEVQGVRRNGIARLLPNGQLDKTFDTGEASDGEIYRIVVQPDGKILVAGEFRKFSGLPRPGLVRLHA